MSPERCCLGVDFGTESGRALLLDADTGEELGISVVEYPSGVIDACLPSDPDGGPLPADWALQDPDDWVLVLERAIPEVLQRAGVPGDRVAGLGVAFTSCTMLPVTAQGVPLCRLERFRARPHAWPKLWKHHAPGPIAERLTEVALERGEPFLERYGGRISSEWQLPKLIELWLGDRELHDATGALVEATDWIVWHLTGVTCRQSCTAGYKGMWSAQDGWPSDAYLQAAYPGLPAPGELLGDAFVPLGTRAGTLTPERAAMLGLPERCAVAVGNVDSFASVPGAGVERPGTFVMAIGTSICDMVVDEREVRPPGITGVVRDGILPGMFGYEAGQAAVGDMLAWFVALLGGDRDSFAALEAGAARLAPGETGLVALDWLNGNRSVLADAELSGVIAGLTLSSTRADVYRALLESIALGNRVIMDTFESDGIALGEIVACGGIAEKSALTMQLLADVSGRPVRVPASAEIPARGAALFAAVAAGIHPGIAAAIAATRPPDARAYAPDPAATAVYDRVHAIHRELYETLGRSRRELLHELKAIRNERSAR